MQTGCLLQVKIMWSQKIMHLNTRLLKVPRSHSTRHCTAWSRILDRHNLSFCLGLGTILFFYSLICLIDRKQPKIVRFFSCLPMHNVMAGHVSMVVSPTVFVPLLNSHGWFLLFFCLHLCTPKLMSAHNSLSIFAWISVPQFYFSLSDEWSVSSVCDRTSLPDHICQFYKNHAVGEYTFQIYHDYCPGFIVCTYCIFNFALCLVALCSFVWSATSKAIT